MAGLLTYSTFSNLPIPDRNSGVFRKSLIELTATGIVQDLHSIPF